MWPTRQGPGGPAPPLTPFPHQVAQPRIECKEQKKEPLCVRCRLPRLLPLVLLHQAGMSSAHQHHRLPHHRHPHRGDQDSIILAILTIVRCGWKIRCVRSVKRAGPSCDQRYSRFVSQVELKFLPLGQEEECDSSSFQEFCQSGLRSSNKWSKVCSLPRDVRDQVGFNTHIWSWTFKIKWQQIGCCLN